MSRQPDSPHFSAFSFVDHIDSVDPGAPVRGRYTIPKDIDAFPTSLVAEAIGQLAAWVSMDRLEYTLRPVAGIAGGARFLRRPQPGETLQLGVEIGSYSESDVAYGGWADIGGERVVELEDCLGPMLPMAEFDDPDAVRTRYQLLCGDGARPNRFHGVPVISVETVAQTSDSLTGRLCVPAEAAFFGDHFPRRPVFPATLLLDSLMRAAVNLAGPGAFTLRARDVKMRAFISPGQELDVEIKLKQAGDVIDARLNAKADGKRVAFGRLDLAGGPLSGGAVR